MKRIYLDNNATTAVDPEVVAVIAEDLKSPPANPSSVHYFGQEAKKRLEKARQTIADFLHVRSSEIIFTSGGTEGINQIIRGAPKGQIISSDLEHSCVYETLKIRGETTFLSPGKQGAVQLSEIENAVKPDTSMIILGAANGETGIKTDISQIGAFAHKNKIPFAVDGVALLGKELFTIPEGVSAMVFSGHKLHGPKGVGFTFIRNSFKIAPLLTGGHQEYGKRAGTENLPEIMGLATAVQLLRKHQHDAAIRMKTLRDELEMELQKRIAPVLINGESPRLPNTSNLSFPGVSGEELLMLLDLAGIAVSHGSACSSGALEPSRVLLNMGISREIARSSIRISLSRQTTREEIDIAIEAMTQIVNRLRGKKA